MSEDKPEAEKAEAEKLEAAPKAVASAAPSTPPPASEEDGAVRTTETIATPAERSTLELSDEPRADEPIRDSGPATHAHDEGHGHGLAHTMSIPLLFGVLVALLLLTVATVSVTSIDLGAEGNLIVGMVIATVKAALVVTFFMHLLWDKKFNLVLFLTAILFVILFLSMTTADRGENQHAIDEYRAIQLGVK